MMGSCDSFLLGGVTFLHASYFSQEELGSSFLSGVRPDLTVIAACCGAWAMGRISVHCFARTHCLPSGLGAHSMKLEIR